MKRYFKTPCDIGFGAGYCYQEFDGEWAIRQVEVYEKRCFTSRDDDSEWGSNLADQPLSEIDLSRSEEIPAEEFERAWSHGSHF